MKCAAFSCSRLKNHKFLNTVLWKSAHSTCVWVCGENDSDRRVDSRVVKHGDLIVAGGEARRIVVRVLDHQQDVSLTGAPPAIRRLGHQVVLNLPLSVQHGQSEELT